MTLVNRKTLLLVIVLSSVVLRDATTVATAVDGAKFSLFTKTRVEIFNNLTDGTSFSIHCKSKDDDLGSHVVGPGQKYGFQFKVNLLATTLFFCGASWQGGRVEFDIFKAFRDILRNRCQEYCKWEARPDAIVGFKENKQNPDINIPWEK